MTYANKTYLLGFPRVFFGQIWYFGLLFVSLPEFKIVNMVTIIDDFLEEDEFKSLQRYCEENEFYIQTAGTEEEHKDFLVLPTPDVIKSELELEGHEIILSFIRKAHADFDTDPRIHCDGIIMDTYVDVAAVLYINSEKGVSRNGTMFYEHRELGDGLPKNVSPEAYNKSLRDSNNIGKFRETDRVCSKPNRLLTYPANKFHAKFPPMIEKGERIVLVTFYREL